MRTSIAILLCVVSMAGAAERPLDDPRLHRELEAPDIPPGAATEWNPGGPVDDDAVLRRLRVEGEALARNGRTLTNWAGQLEPKRADLKLEKRSRRKFSPSELAARIEPAVVVVGTLYLCDKCSRFHTSTAAGFFITSSGAVATSRHVLANYVDSGRGVVVLARDGRVHSVRRILASDDLNDLVVLETGASGTTPLPLSPDAVPGMPVVVLSHPDQHFYMTTTGVVSRRSTSGRRNRRKEVIGVTADFAKGSSGGPVLDEQGNVIALVNNTQSIYYHEHRDKPGEHLQMVIKNCTPAGALLELVTAR